jgi:hypothetical protein
MLVRRQNLARTDSKCRVLAMIQDDLLIQTSVSRSPITRVGYILRRSKHIRLVSCNTPVENPAAYLQSSTTNVVEGGRYFGKDKAEDPSKEHLFEMKGARRNFLNGKHRDRLKENTTSALASMPCLDNRYI